jgi:3-deoxy-D-manno-octulosonate 8-phosphate phosphatase (KDO 8-P phosphatase)
MRNMIVRRGAAARAKRIKLLVLDVDGVLTDGRMALSEGGDELKFFHTHDGMAVNLARRAGLKIAFVTAEVSQIAAARGKKLGVDDVVTGARRKGETLEELAAKHGLSAGECAYIGDDLLDIPALQRAGLAIAVANAVPEVKRLAHVVTSAAGGQGAVREAIEWILNAQGLRRLTVARYVAEHGGRSSSG